MSKPGEFVGIAVSEAGRLQLDETQRRTLDMFLLTLAGKKADLTIVEHEDTRSVQANRYLWGVVYDRMERLSESGYTAEDFHDLMCDRFLARKQFVLVNRETGEHEEREIPRRSRRLTVREFHKFVEDVRLFAGEFYGIETPDPDPDWWKYEKAAPEIDAAQAR